MDRLMRVIRREPQDDGKIAFTFLRLFPGLSSPCIHVADEADPSYFLLMLDGVMFDGRDDARWGFRFHRACHDDGRWGARIQVE
jgi:hypothetical protein